VAFTLATLALIACVTSDGLRPMRFLHSHQSVASKQTTPKKQITLSARAASSASLAAELTERTSLCLGCILGQFLLFGFLLPPLGCSLLNVPSGLGGTHKATLRLTLVGHD
jgi:hypothetical protein